MEGRDTGLPPDVADLFPDRLVDSELGEIPEGWEVGCLADIAVAPRRGADPTGLHDDTPYIGLETHAAPLGRSYTMGGSRKGYKQQVCFQRRASFYSVSYGPIFTRLASRR